MVFDTPPPFAGQTVLVVDGEADMRLYLRMCLTAMGIGRIVEATCGSDALRQARALVPDLVISDARQQGRDSLALCQALRREAATRSVPVLVVNSEDDAVPPCADGVLVRPFNAAGLQAEVARLVPGVPRL